MTAELSPQERATVDRIEQAPDALGLREEVAEAAYTAIEWSGCAGSMWSRVPTSYRRKWYEIADALLPLIQRREAEAAERALATAENAIASSVSYGFELRPDGTEDPLAAIYVEGLRDACQIIEHQIGGTR